MLDILHFTTIGNFILRVRFSLTNNDEVDAKFADGFQKIYVVHRGVTVSFNHRQPLRR
jgi:hypothetical protein